MSSMHGLNTAMSKNVDTGQYHNKIEHQSPQLKSTMMTKTSHTTCMQHMHHAGGMRASDVGGRIQGSRS